MIRHRRTPGSPQQTLTAVQDHNLKIEVSVDGSTNRCPRGGPSPHPNPQECQPSDELTSKLLATGAVPEQNSSDLRSSHGNEHNFGGLLKIIHCLVCPVVIRFGSG